MTAMGHAGAVAASSGRGEIRQVHSIPGVDIVKPVQPPVLGQRCLPGCTNADPATGDDGELGHVCFALAGQAPVSDENDGGVLGLGIEVVQEQNDSGSPSRHVEVITLLDGGTSDMVLRVAPENVEALIMALGAGLALTRSIR